MPYLHAIFEGAKRFGLTTSRSWQTLDDSLEEAGPDATMSECVDALTAELARRILRAQRGNLLKQPVSHRSSSARRSCACRSAGRGTAARRG
jgi:hypothetical protein